MRVPALLTLIILVLASGTAAFGGRAVEHAPELTKKQVKALILVAKTPEQHLELARYYRSEAVRLTDESKDHTDMKAAYNQNPSSHIIPKWPTMGEHCEHLVDDYSKAAKEAAAMAEMHEEMAKQAAQ